MECVRCEAPASSGLCAYCDAEDAVTFEITNGLATGRPAEWALARVNGFSEDAETRMRIIETAKQFVEDFNRDIGYGLDSVKARD